MGSVDAAPLVFSFLDGGFSSVGVWIGVIGFVSVLTIPYVLLTFPLYVVTGSLDRRRRWLAVVPFVNASVLARLATGSLDRTTALALLRLSLLFCLIVHVVVFAWLWSMENYGGSVLRAWIDGIFKLGTILFGGQALYGPDREGAAATSWFYAALALPFAHWLVFSAGMGGSGARDRSAFVAGLAGGHPGPRRDSAVGDRAASEDVRTTRPPAHGLTLRALRPPVRTSRHGRSAAATGRTTRARARCTGAALTCPHASAS